MQDGTIGVGIVGLGFRGGNNLGRRMAEAASETGLRVVALCDERSDRLAEVQADLRDAFEEEGVTISPRGYADAAQLVEDPELDLVVVTTPQCVHREPALAGLEAGKRVYVDKPLAHDMADARAICEAMTTHRKPILLGFTRRYEVPWRKAYDLVQDGVIGDLHMVLLRDVIPFHSYFHRWHRRMEWSGGALNDKSSHHFDVMNWFSGSRARTLSAVGGRRVFHAKPDAPARCLECDQECPYRVGPTRGRKLTQEQMDIEGDSWTRATDEFHRVDNCVYLPGADIKDHAIMQVAYENGIVGSLFVSFFGPRSDDQETMELVGTKGRILLNRHRGELDIVSDYGKSHELIDCKSEEFGSSHFGADLELVREMARFAGGASPLVSAPEGFEATRMVMATHASIAAGGTTIDMTAYDGADVPSRFDSAEM
ncbi:MAG: Gfo/Idh/MocA family oxidoreductase [Lentisphaerae bacterium]|jgi:predicted dehydrogenase|nr:Gfo/Idh/MocA family oxidoreductase [Lentisphaerota bacterium]MBT4817581.1 Gfo/Idh/MocA family oxidoreductase [Lentisphaerota bacterium]MBT5608526.1 Gfo/Idh/MocA family oxidoreductase [Lentisphaerota bacterium]MBT7060239.1 Gfo/Idh/MocA family oxidoreductase [Lentisphaerota bacterium]MBT7843243.1 Gfo/Idh/MocA family oxidoreductase [Lentisphaerota bacterium]